MYTYNIFTKYKLYNISDKKAKKILQFLKNTPIILILNFKKCHKNIYVNNKQLQKRNKIINRYFWLFSNIYIRWFNTLLIFFVIFY